MKLLYNYVNDAANYKINSNKTATSKSFEHKTKLIRSTPNNNSRLNAEVIALSKYLSNFWINLFICL